MNVPEPGQMAPDVVLPDETGANGFDNLSPSGHDPQCRKRAAVDHGLTIHEYAVLAIASVDHIDIDREVTSELRRHTGGV